MRERKGEIKPNLEARFLLNRCVYCSVASPIDLMLPLPQALNEDSHQQLCRDVALQPQMHLHHWSLCSEAPNFLGFTATLFI